MPCDVVIVGGGPAGLASAIEAARKGLSVRVYEKSSGPPDGPGETLHPKIADVLHHLGVEREISKTCLGRTGGIWVSIQGTSLRHETFDPLFGRGYHVRRSVLNAALANRAQLLGAQVTYGAVVQKLDFMGENVCIKIQMANDMLAQMVTARCLIDATGKVGWSARRMKTPPGYRSAPISIRYGWKHVTPKQNVDPVFIQRRDRWIWQAHLGDGRLAWVERGGQNGSGTGADGTWFLSSRAVDGNVIRVGDAACRVDPSIGHGVARALLSGVASAGVVAEICSANGPESGVFSALKDRYGNWITNSFVQDTKFLSRICQQ